MAVKGQYAKEAMAGKSGMVFVTTASGGFYKPMYDAGPVQFGKGSGPGDTVTMGDLNKGSVNGSWQNGKGPAQQSGVAPNGNLGNGVPQAGASTNGNGVAVQQAGAPQAGYVNGNGVAAQQVGAQQAGCANGFFVPSGKNGNFQGPGLVHSPNPLSPTQIAPPRMHGMNTMQFHTCCLHRTCHRLISSSL